MRPDDAASDLAVFQKLPESYPAKCACHLGGIALLLPLHYHPAPSPLAACVEAEVSVYGKDDRNADFRNDIVHLGFGGW